MKGELHRHCFGGCLRTEAKQELEDDYTCSYSLHVIEKHSKDTQTMNSMKSQFLTILFVFVFFKLQNESSSSNV